MRASVGIGLVVLALGSAAAAGASELRWIRIEVDAHLRGDGRFEVEERWEMAVPDEWTSLRRNFGFGTGQRVELRSFREVDDDGAARPLEPGQPTEPGRYRYTPESAVLE